MGLHIGQLLGSEWERNYCSTPNDYQYLVMRNDTNGTEYAYFIGCFGDGNGLPFGTGYAVCEIGSLNAARKYVGTWSRYKPFGNVQICFTSRREGDEGLGGRTLGCYVPGKSAFDNMTETNTLINIVNAMREHGWCVYEKEENH